MNKIKLLIFYAILCSLLSIGCNFNSDDSNSPASRGVTIKGSFSSTPRPSMSDKGSASFKTKEFIPSQVSQVIVFPGQFNHFYVKEVQNGSFSVEVEPDYPYGIIFADSEKRFLGFMTYGNNINSLPVNAIKEGVSSIDLGTLASANVEVNPEKNPIGNQIVLTDDEVQSYAQANSFFSSIVQNPDTDGDGIIDLLTPSYYRIAIMYGINGGVINPDLSVQLSNPSAMMQGYRMNLFSYEKNGDYPYDLQWWDPNNTDITETPESFRNIFPGNWAGYGSKFITSAYPSGGEYTIRYGSSKYLHFKVPDQSRASENILLAIPKVTLNQNNTIKSISWIYRRPGSANPIDPKLLTKQIMIQIRGEGVSVHPTQPNFLYISEWIDVSVSEHVLSNQNISWANVWQVSMAYEDRFGNHYVVSFDKL